jgi:endonuclease YncB( thermonuclease family)
MKKSVAAALVAVSIVGAGWAFRHVVDPYETVYKIADGDTFILSANKQAVRLFGLDAPEFDQCYGRESMQKLDQLLSKRKVQLKEPLVDHFGRVVALVYVDGKLINEIMIREGFAAYQSEPGSGKELMKAAHAYAKSHQLGIYSAACTDLVPPDPACAIKGNHDQDRDADVYLLPTCPHYATVIVRRFEGDRWFCSPKEAQQAGFTLSPDCNPATFTNPKPTPKLPK